MKEKIHGHTRMHVLQHSKIGLYDDEKKHRLDLYIIVKSVLVERMRVKASVRSEYRLHALFALYINISCKVNRHR